MATAVARVTAIADALIDGTATAQQKVNLGDRFTAHWRNELIGLGLDPDTMTSEQKAQVVVNKVKDFVKAIYKAEDGGVATAQDSLDSAIASADSSTETDWPEESY